MKKIFINYGQRINLAILSVIKDILKDLSESKISTNHCFYITFKTNHPKVKISKKLAKEYPNEITIVLQNQYWDLEVKKNEFSVVLAFNKQRENLCIPFDSIIKFYDPFVKFSIQLELRRDKKKKIDQKQNLKNSPKKNTAKKSKKIITLDDFRKRK